MVSPIILVTISLLALNANAAFWSSSTETTYDLNGVCDAYFKSLLFFLAEFDPRDKEDINVSSIDI